MNQFISLSNGMIINLGAVAYISTEVGPTFSTRAVTLMYAAVTTGRDDLHTQMELSFKGKEAEELLAALEERGIDVAALRKAREYHIRKPAVKPDKPGPTRTTKGPKIPWMGRKDQGGKTTYRVE